MSAFHFLHPSWLLALPPLLAIAGWLAWRGSRDGTWSQIVDAELLQALRLSAPARHRSPWLWVALAWTLAVLALAGPAWERQQVNAFRLPAAWVLVLDLSPSMAAADVAPDRATRARYAITDLLSAAHDARVGLIAFAGEPHTVVPVTTDIATIRALLQPLSPALMPEQGDSLASALDEAGRLLRAVHAEHGKIIVLSDGISDPADALRAAQRLREQGATVHTLGIGTAKGAPQPDGQGGFARDNQGHILLARLQTDPLQRVASAGGGRFFALDAVPDLISTLQADRSDTPSGGTAARDMRVTTWQNGGVWLLLPLLLLAAVLARRGWV